jgi:hypothetical protein
MNRNDFIKNASAALAGVSFLPELLSSPTKINNPKTRFIFIHKSNGTYPKVLTPPSLSPKQLKADKEKKAFEVELGQHELPKWMNAIESHKNDLTILQGISGKMCTTGHHTWCSALGAYKANERISSIKWATVDFECAKLYPSPMEHIELACFPMGGGNARGNINGIEKGFSARGARQPNYAFGSPKIALQEIFKSVSQNKNDQINYNLDRKLLDFTLRNQKKLAQNLKGIENLKIQNYAKSTEALIQRNLKIDAMASQIQNFIPLLKPQYLLDEINTVDRQFGHTEILLSSLISGLTNVITFTVDELGTPYTGLPGLESEKVNLHDVGHGKSLADHSADQIREKVRIQHMKLIDKIVKRLKNEPEGKGTMFDNTVLLYFPENGETHHSHGTEYPFMILAGTNCKLNLGNRYIRLPKHGDEGHKTLGNLWTTLLNAYGNPIEHYGDYDLSLKTVQSGPIKQLLT